MRFSDMKYERPDIEAVCEEIAQLVKRHDAAESFDQAQRVFFELNEMEAQFETMYTLCFIRHSIDTRDEFYDAENTFFDTAAPLYEEAVQQWRVSLAESKFRAQYEERYGGVIFTKVEMALKTFSPEIMDELRRENELVSEYDKLLASAQIQFEGGTYTRSQLEPFKQDPDDGRRLAAWRADAGFLSGIGGRLDGIYNELVSLRDEMGRKLGYGGYTRLGYYRMERNCYTKEDIELFRGAVVKYVVPLSEKLYRRQARELGVRYPLSYADAELSFRSGNPKPAGNPEEILETGKRFYHALSSETAEFIDVMLENGLMDVLSREGKASGGYCTSLAKYKRPFIFANFNGTSHDVEVITHEAGHAFAFWTARYIVPLQLQNAGMEASEVHSMAMEFFAWPWAEEFFGGDAGKFLYSHLKSAVNFLPYGALVDHFQHVVYENPGLTSAGRHEKWKELMAVYMPWIRLDADEIPFYGEGRAWQRQIHIYQSPFYYIDYCLAQTMALQFWSMILKDPKAAWERYMEYTRQAGTRVFTELIANAGLKSPFDEALLRDITQAAADWLEGFDLSGIS